MAEKELVYRLMMAKCDCSSMEQYLNLPKDHGVYFHDTDHPMMNALDYVSNKNIFQFGRCTSKLNPENAMFDIASKTMPLFFMVDKIKNALGCNGCKCHPVTFKVWGDTNEGNLLDGADGILNTSTLKCVYGGTIEIMEVTNSSGDNDEGDGNDDGTDASKKGIAERMPQEVAEKIGSLNESGNSDFEQEMQEDAVSWYQANQESFASDYGVSDEISLSNYANNMCQSIPAEAFNEDGYICDSSLLYGFRMGGSTVSDTGAGCVAEYNALSALGEMPSLCNVIYQAEKTQAAEGIMAQGPLAVTMAGMRNHFYTQGIETSIHTAYEYAESEFHAPVSILGISENNEVHFYTLLTDMDGNITCAENPELNAENLLSEHEGGLKIVMEVMKNNV